MRTPRRTRGFTLVESMVAMAVMLIAAVGVLGLSSTGMTMNGNSRRMMRATVIAQDLLDNIALWPYQDNVGGSRLANTSTANDADLADAGFAYASSSDPVADGIADHGEADLTAGGTTWTGIPTASLGEFERYWSVAYVDSNGNGVNDLAQIAVIVRWRQGGTGEWHRVVLLSGKLNPSGS